MEIEKIDSKISFNATNKTGGYNGRAILRKTWLDQLGITKENNKIELILTKNEIIIRKKDASSEN